MSESASVSPAALRKMAKAAAKASRPLEGPQLYAEAGAIIRV